MKDNWENLLNRRHTLGQNVPDKHVEEQYLHIRMHNEANEILQCANKYDNQALHIKCQDSVCVRWGYWNTNYYVENKALFALLKFGIG